MVPVVDINRVPLMPCSEKRARLLMERGQAKPFYQKGFFCIILTKEPFDRKYQKVALGIDPGAMREGYTIATNKTIIMNIVSNTPYWVRDHVASRRMLKKFRRGRKTPYRKMRNNRSSLRKVGRIPPSTKARWDAKLRIINILRKILPITDINVEDIKAVTKKNDNYWNESFSPIEVGKNYFYSKLNKCNINIFTTKGFDTFKRRNFRLFNKNFSKLEYIWETHNIDSHCLIEILLNKIINPIKKVIKLNYIEFHRRQLHVLKPSKDGFRKKYGTTITFGIPRLSLIKLIKNNKLYLLGGNSKNKVSIHRVHDYKRISSKIKIKNIQVLCKMPWIIEYIK